MKMELQSKANVYIQARDTQLSQAHLSQDFSARVAQHSHITSLNSKVSLNSSVDVIHYFGEHPDSEMMLGLRQYGCTVHARSTDQGVNDIVNAEPAAIVVELSNLSKSFSVCRQLRSAGINMPLVAITSSVDPFDEVLGLELGIDEVIHAKTHPRVMLARLRAISRRTNNALAHAPQVKLTFGNLVVDGSKREVNLGETRIVMTSAEFDLLWLLAQHAGQVVRRDEVLKRLRGLTESHLSRSVDARLYRLRKRFFEVPDIVARLKTVRPYGYMFANMAW
jgi:DNA-binding response OmpR family regulator